MSPLGNYSNYLAGLMTSVVLFSFLGERIKKNVLPVFIKKKG